MDMKNILQNMDAAAAGEKPSTAQADVNDMKTILESIQSVEECGMGEMPQQMPQEPKDKMSMNVTLNAQGDAVEDLIKLMGGAVTPQEAPVRMPAEMPMAHDHGDDMDDMDDMGDMQKLMKISSGEPMEDEVADDEAVEEAEGEYSNSPDEEYQDHEYMTKDLAGGMHKEKKSYKPTNGGDNPMALEQSIKEELWAALNEKFTEGKKKKDRGNRGAMEGSKGKTSRGDKSSRG